MKLTFIIAYLFSSFAYANFDKGLEIAKKMDEANKGYKSEVSQMKLVLIDPVGKNLEREMKGVNLEKDDVIKGLMTFEKPEDVNGTKLLTWSYRSEGEDDDQWLFLPSLKRVKRINSRTRGSSFMGSEFSYADLTAQTIEKYKYKFIKDSKIEGQDVWVIERYPKQKSNYSKVELHVSKKMLTSIRNNYFNKRDELYKTATFSGFKQYKVGGKSFFRASEVLMSNLQSKKKSKFIWVDRKLGEKVQESRLNKRSLR